MIQYQIRMRDSQLSFLSENLENLLPYKFPIEIELPKKPMILFIRDLSDEQRRIVEECDKKRDSFGKNSRATKVVRDLYGVIGFERHSVYNGFHFHNFFIPNENVDTVKKSLRTGVFSKEFPEEDLGVLRAIYERNNQLRSLGIKRRHPLFYVSEVAKLSDRDYVPAVESLLHLVGLLGFCLNKTSNRRGSYFERRFIVPRAREELIDSLLK